MAKAIEINGSIKQYSSVPKSWGNIIAGFDLLSDSELETHGFYDVEYPSDYDNIIHNLGSLSFDSDNSVFSYSKTNKTWSQSVSELKSDKISNLKEVYNQKLSKTDWIIIRDQELGNTTEQSVLDARAELRTECADKEAEINALSTKANIVKYILPNNL
tara:strand:+ start:18740 stop:19216 length:477 start_codon:yes stop_codon:yes gene_type:complete